LLLLIAGLLLSYQLSGATMNTTFFNAANIEIEAVRLNTRNFEEAKESLSLGYPWTDVDDGDGGIGIIVYSTVSDFETAQAQI
jgi:hypothetical protein